MADMFQVSHVLQIMMKQKQNMRKGENSTRQLAITSLLNAWNKFLKSIIALNKKIQTNWKIATNISPSIQLFKKTYFYFPILIHLLCHWFICFSSRYVFECLYSFDCFLITKSLIAFDWFHYRKISK